ncbi:MAG: hypothetical protein C5B51_11800 [Terriglobia bacterium]|nr:MAG: hypothetical protein C5B51_11800 [Terriglobia bacterium]
MVLKSEGATALVSSAASGADLLAQAEAEKLGLRRRVVLPFQRERFIESSVADRPGDWVLLYNQLLDSVSASGDLVVLEGAGGDTEAYIVLTGAILDQAQALGSELYLPVTAVLVWDGTSHKENDLTAAFGDEARRRGLRLIEVMTL